MLVTWAANGRAESRVAVKEGDCHDTSDHIPN